ncbi:STAS domain-containing protein [Vibrio cincinnatiensis]|uniref:STAS domain-containing protein n=1 Tax=Vibrio cincinnatiensis TaxID=675 RepID=UPI001EDCACDA|nr:STAS domain-containing protein [Vibrio cincinnatiensis]MCG3728434.1 STAS domain-containing protein [Vibrio cincinnatiensis]
MQLLQENSEQVQIALSGELTIYQVHALYEFLTPWVEKNGDLLLDIEQVTDLDTSTIQLLLMIHKVKRQQHQRCVLLGENPLLHQVIEKLGVNSMVSRLVVQSNLK